MFSRSFAAVMIVTSCTAAAGGSYLAFRHNAVDAGISPVVEAAAPATAPQATMVAGSPVPTLVEPLPQPVARTRSTTARRTSSPVVRPTVPSARAATPDIAPSPSPQPVTVEPAAATSATPTPPLDDPRAAAVQPEPEPESYEIVVPASAVIGLEIENTISSEQAKVEDRVDARVTRDVYADGRLAIPSGSRVIGAVTVVERGGKVKDRARLGVRFHTLVLPGGRQIPLRTDEVMREGDSPGAESSKKIGGAAIGGAVLGAILGGGKGAMTGAGVGAAGGTAAVMAGGRNPAVLASGSVLTVKLSSPVTVEVER